MGLDISVYMGPLTKVLDAVPRDDDSFWDDAYENGWLIPTVIHPSMNRIAPLTEDAVYRTAGLAFGFRAGSYSGYNAYRDWLSRTILDTDPETVWHNEATYASRPFYEQIAFGDNEGTIGPEVCIELAADYLAHRDQVQGSDWYDLYDTWTRAFVLAAKSGGAIDYH